MKEDLGHLVSGQGISPMRQNIKAITDLEPTTNIMEARHMIGLKGYYRKFFPVFSDMIRPLNELSLQLFTNILDIAYMIKKSLKVNTASGTTLGPIRITPLKLNTDDQSFVHNFII